MACKEDIKIETAPFDARFPNVNQTRHCWQHYVDFHKCEKAKGEDAPVCLYYKKVYQSMCPVAWVRNYSSQIPYHMCTSVGFSVLYKSHLWTSKRNYTKCPNGGFIIIYVTCIYIGTVLIFY